MLFHRSRYDDFLRHMLDHVSGKNCKYAMSAATMAVLFGSLPEQPDRVPTSPPADFGEEEPSVGVVRDDKLPFGTIHEIKFTYEGCHLTRTLKRVLQLPTGSDRESPWIM